MAVNVPVSANASGAVSEIKKITDAINRPDTDAVLAAIEAVLQPGSGAPRTPDLGGTVSTQDVGKAIAQALTAR